MRKGFWSAGKRISIGMSLCGLALIGWLLVGYAQQPLSPAQKVEQMLRLLQNKQYEQAKQLALSIVESPAEYEQLTWSDKVALHRGLALIYSVEGRADLADEQFRKAAEIRRQALTPPPPPPSPPPPPPTPSQKLRQVIALCRQKQFAEAEPIALNIANTPAEYQSLDESERTILHYCLAQIYSATGRAELADAQLQQVLAIRQARAQQPQPEALSNRVREALALCQIANFPEALQLIEEIQQHPDYASLSVDEKVVIHRCLAQIYAADGEDDKARAQFREILKLNPRFALKDPNSPLSEVLSPHIEKLLDSVKPKPSPAALTLGGLGLAALIFGQRGGEASGAPDPNQFQFLLSPSQIEADGTQTARMIFRIRDSLGRLVTTDSSTEVNFVIDNPGGTFNITLDQTKGTLINKTDGEVASVQLTCRVQNGEAIVSVKVSAPLGTSANTRLTFNITATAGESTYGASLIAVVPDREAKEVNLYLRARVGTGDDVTDSARAVITNVDPEALNKEADTGALLTLYNPTSLPGDTQRFKTLARRQSDPLRWGVEIRQGSATSATLFWEPALLPTGYTFRLTDTAGGTLVDNMANRDSLEVSFVDGIARLLLVAEPSPSRQRREAPVRPLITGLTAQATRGGQVVATFSLNRSAQVRATLRAMSGQVMATLPARAATRGMNTLMLIGDTMPKLPPGTYLLEVEASTDDGMHTRAAIPMVVKR